VTVEHGVTLAHAGDGAARPGDADELLSTRLRDLSLVDLDAFVAVGRGQAAPDRSIASSAGEAGARDATALIAAYADDVADALREAKNRIAQLRGQLAGPDPLGVVELAPRQRASADAAAVARTRDRLLAQAETARALARLADLAGALAPKLFEADRRRA
jgi:hypothetical protein